MTLLTRKKEFRTAPVQMTSENTFTVVACKYGVKDDYGTMFKEGCFDEYALEKLPIFCWSHNWEEPIGRCINPRSGDLPDGGRGWLLDVSLDAVPAVPRAMQAAHQLASKTLTDVSVGFCRTASEEMEDGVTLLTGCECDEVSVVLVGGVPGAKVLMSRSGKTQYVDAELAASVLTRFQHGDIDLHEALGELKAAAVEGEPDDKDEESLEPEKTADEDGKETEGEEAKETDEAIDEGDIDAALALVE